MNRFYKTALQALASVAILTLSTTAARAERYAAGWDPFFGAGVFPGVSIEGATAEDPALRWTVSALFDITGCSPDSLGSAVVRGSCKASVVSASVNFFLYTGNNAPSQTDTFTLTGVNVPKLDAIFFSPNGAPIGVESSEAQTQAASALGYGWFLEFLYNDGRGYYGPRLSYSVAGEGNLSKLVSNPIEPGEDGITYTFPVGDNGTNGTRGFFANPVPEPGTLALLLAPLAVIGLKRRAKRAAPTA